MVIGKYPREWKGTPGFYECPANAFKIDSKKGWKDGYSETIEIITCETCKRKFGSMEYFEHHGTFTHRSNPTVKEASQ
jgi:hypothetical protein